MGDPVWFAQSDHRRFIWVSSPERRHSGNVRAPPEVGIVPLLVRRTSSRGPRLAESRRPRVASATPELHEVEAQTTPGRALSLSPGQSDSPP